VQVGGGTSGLTSSSDDDEDFRSISFPPDDAIQKVNNRVLRTVMCKFFQADK